MKLFLDETAWTQIIDKSGQYHSEVFEKFAAALKKGDHLFTHNIAVGLALTQLREEHGLLMANKFNEIIDEAHKGTYLNILWVGRRTQKDAGRSMRSNPEIELSIFDFAAYNLMKRRRIHRILTTKNAFKKLGFEVIPETGE